MLNTKVLEENNYDKENIHNHYVSIDIKNFTFDDRYICISVSVYTI